MISIPRGRELEAAILANMDLISPNFTLASFAFPSAIFRGGLTFFSFLAPGPRGAALGSAFPSARGRKLAPGAAVEGALYRWDLSGQQVAMNFGHRRVAR